MNQNQLLSIHFGVPLDFVCSSIVYQLVLRHCIDGPVSDEQNIVNSSVRAVLKIVASKYKNSNKLKHMPGWQKEGGQVAAKRDTFTIKSLEGNRIYDFSLLQFYRKRWT